jgi:hypothetical protein
MSQIQPSNSANVTYNQTQNQSGDQDNNNNNIQSANVWKTGLNKGGNIDFNISGNPSISGQTVDKSKDYVSKTIEASEKLSFDNSTNIDGNKGQQQQKSDQTKSNVVSTTGIQGNVSQTQNSESNIQGGGQNQKNQQNVTGTQNISGQNVGIIENNSNLIDLSSNRSGISDHSQGKGQNKGIGNLENVKDTVYATDSSIIGGQNTNNNSSNRTTSQNPQSATINTGVSGEIKTGESGRSGTSKGISGVNQGTSGVNSGTSGIISGTSGTNVSQNQQAENKKSTSDISNKTSSQQSGQNSLSQNSLSKGSGGFDIKDISQSGSNNAVTGGDTSSSKDKSEKINIQSNIKQQETSSSNVKGVQSSSQNFNDNGLSKQNQGSQPSFSDNVDFGNQLNFGANSGDTKSVQSTNITANNANLSKQLSNNPNDESVINIDDSLTASQVSQQGKTNNFMKPATTNATSEKINLNKIQDKKQFQGDRNFTLNHDKPDYTNIKSKIDNTIKVNKEMMGEVEKGNEELAKKYEQIQKEKNEKLKDYRDMILKMKKEKRGAEKEKEENLYGVDESQLPEDVKKRMKMRQDLANRLKK